MVFLASAVQAARGAVAFAVKRLLDDSAANQTADANSALQAAAQRMRVTLLSLLLGFSVNWVLCMGLIWHLRTNRAGALKGDAVAARKVILPAFEPVLIVLSVFNGAHMIFMLATQIADTYENSFPLLVTGALISSNKFMALFVLVVLFQKSISLPAVKRSVVISLVLAYYCMPYMYLAAKYGKPDQQKALLAATPLTRSLHLIPFVYAFIKPPHRATKRTIREFCAVAIVHFAFSVLINRFIMNPKTVSVGHYVMYTSLTMIALSPLVVWRVLKADTEYWRGIGQRACALQDFFQRENGLSERVSSEGLHVLIEMNRKCVIDFAYLELVRQLGVGSTSTVFQGTLKAKTHVAVKVYAPTSCSEDVVAAFSHEAAMCRVLDHPNIVKFHGMCVAPPTICLVFQLCQGSLAATLEDQARRQSAHPARQQLLISVGYMLDAARAVAYLHSFSPPFVHRDIKSENFLVDAECSVQLSDFGESRCLTMLEQKTLALRPKVAVLEEKACVLNNPVDSPTGTTMSLVDSPCLANISADYAAPEVIEGKGEQICYGEAADVYSLAVTMWDILHPSADKFPQASGDNAQVMEVVLHGVRPRMDTNTPPRLRGIIERAWQREPGLRPSAEQIVAALEDVQEELCARLVLELLGDLGEGLSGARSSSARSAGPHHTSPFPGAFLVDRMIDRRFVRSPAEAIRMGNALMDSSVLHHVNHSRSFENSATAQYYFDLDEVQLSLPTHGERSMARDSSAASQNESSIPMLTRGSNGGDVRTSFSFVRTRNDGLCHCRQLGQRLGTVKTSRFHSRRRFKAAPEPTAESNLLTAALLVEEDSSHEENYHSLNIVSGTAASTA
jgi:serine/threonine protein kinase